MNLEIVRPEHTFSTLRKCCPPINMLAYFQRIAAVLLVLRALAAQQQTSVHGETADPAEALRPRNFNPHPYAIELDASQQNAVREIGDNQLQQVSNIIGGSAAADVSKNHVKRRQSPALYNQGPIQFPTNNNEVSPTTTADNNRPLQPNNGRPLVVGSGTRLFQSGRLPQVSSTIRTAAAATDYEDYVSTRRRRLMHISQLIYFGVTMDRLLYYGR